jgi:hypothetical protein
MLLRGRLTGAQRYRRKGRNGRFKFFLEIFWEVGIWISIGTTMALIEGPQAGDP